MLRLRLFRKEKKLCAVALLYPNKLETRIRMKTKIRKRDYSSVWIIWKVEKLDYSNVGIFDKFKHSVIIFLVVEMGKNMAL